MTLHDAMTGAADRKSSVVAGWDGVGELTGGWSSTATNEKKMASRGLETTTSPFDLICLQALCGCRTRRARRQLASEEAAWNDRQRLDAVNDECRALLASKAGKSVPRGEVMLACGRRGERESE